MNHHPKEINHLQELKVISLDFSDTEDSDESIDINPIHTTVERLQRRFHEFYKEFTRQGRHEHRDVSMNCIKSSRDREDMNIETNLSFCWMNCYEKKV